MTLEKHHEVGKNLSYEAPKVLSLLDQLSLWSSLGITLTIPAAAVFVLHPYGAPTLSFTAAILAVVVGVGAGSIALGGAARIGASTGAPSMVLLRGLFGNRGSRFPTILNLFQCLGWTAVEVLVIGHAAKAVVGGPLALWIIGAGALATLMAIRPLGSVRVLRRYALIGATIATAYLLFAVVRHGVHVGHGSWSGFWLAVDVAIALPISWAPLAADYSRHSRTPRKAFVGTFVGFFLGAGIYFVLGLLALVTIVASHQQGDPYAFSQALLILPLGIFALLILVVDEIDEAFANVYSTVASIQNLRPLWDRRRLATVVGVISTGVALSLNVVGYESFLFAIGAVFVPLFAVVLVDWFVVSKGNWDLSETSKLRGWTLFPWALGFVVYQLINPGSAPIWSQLWINIDSAIHFTPAPWMSASIFSFLVAALLTLVVGPLVDSRR
ncbi:MAG TPA: cytosine permease [Candidatus Nanopelagicaceae bacterium]|nr:cytosine permease [Candidatus Nanopelagicaceae bacterium]